MTTDELQDKAQTFRLKLTMWLKAVAGLFMATLPYSLILVLVVAGGIFIAYLNYHSTSENEQAAEDARTSTTVQDSSTSVAEGQVERAEESVEQAEKTSQNAQKQREKAKETNTANTNYQEANRQRCLTFPQSKECQK